MKLRVFAAVLACGAFAAASSAAPSKPAPQMPSDWSSPVKPFRIAKNIYYVGTRGLAAYLITSGRQAILLDTSMGSNAVLLEANIRSLGFSLRDVKAIIISHAHWDHVGALAQLKHDTGASLAVMEQDVAAIESGHPEGDNIYPATSFAPVQVDRHLHDGDEVAIGEAKLRAVLTPGHTKGCTTWLMRTHETGRTVNVIFPCSMSVAGNTLVGNSTYPAIVRDYQASFQRLRGIAADIVLTSHPEVAGVIERREAQLGGKRHAFIDPNLLADVVAKAQLSFDTELAKELALSNLGQSDQKSVAIGVMPTLEYIGLPFRHGTLDRLVPHRTGRSPGS